MLVHGMPVRAAISLVGDWGKTPLFAQHRVDSLKEKDHAAFSESDTLDI